MAALAPRSWLTQALGLMPTQLHKALDAWSLRIAQKRAQRAPSGGAAPHAGSAYRLQAQALAGLTCRRKEKATDPGGFFRWRSVDQAARRFSISALVSPSSRGRWYSSCLNSSLCSCSSFSQAALSMLMTLLNCSAVKSRPVQFSSS